MTDRTATAAPTTPLAPLARRARATRLASLAAGSVVVLTACSAAASVDPQAAAVEPVADYAVADDMVGWGDDRTHLVVATDAAPGVSGGASAEDEQLMLVTPAGSRVLDGPPPVLLPVVAEGTYERELLEAAPAGSFIAVDVDGELGVPGTRYLRTLTAVRTLDAVDPTDVGSDPGETTVGDDGDGDELMAELDGTIAEPETHVAIQLELDATDREIVDKIDAIGGVVEVEVIGTGIIAVALDPVAETVVAEAIGEIDGVASVNDDVLASVSADPRQAEQWAIENTGSSNQAAGWSGVVGADIRADEAWNVTTGAGVVVAVIDSGQDLDHRDLASNGWTNSGEICANGVDDDANGYIDDCRGWDFGSGDADADAPPSSNGFHGTHVAGIIAAARNGVGVVGAAPDAVLMPLKVARDDGAIPMSGVAAAINYAVDNGADVINLSLGTAPGTWLGYDSPTELAIRHAQSNGVVVVVAAGNDGKNLDSTGPGWPAGFSKTYDNVLTVGASRNDDTHASFSNTGSYVGLHAPGWAVLSTLPGDTEGFQYGTSMAAPYVAAGAAAVIAAGQADTPDAVISHLQTSAVDLGWGTRLDLAAAVGYVAPLVGRQLDVTVSGADQLVADAGSELGWSIAAAPDTAATGFRMSVAARHDGVISAVAGLEVTFTDAAGDLATVTSGEAGSFPVLPIRDPAALVDGGALVRASFSAPATEYAFVVELIDDAGAEASDRSVTYVSVPSGQGPAAGAAPSTTVPVPGAPTTQAPGSPPATTPPAETPSPVTISPGTGPGVGAPRPVPTTQPTGAPTAPGGTVAPPTDAGTPATTLAPRGDDPSTTTPASATTTTTTTTAPIGSSPTTAPPAPPAPPEPAGDGVYRADSISPRSGRTSGFTQVTLTGRFPTRVPVYVWFGDQPTAVAAGRASETVLTVDSPAVETPGVRDVIVRFATDRPYELRLENAYTYTDSATAPPTTAPGVSTPGTSSPSPTPNPTTPTTAPAGTPPADGPGGSPAPPTTSSTVPIGGSGPTPAPPPAQPTDPAPTDPGDSSPPSGAGGGDTGDPGPDRRLGDLTLRRQPSTGALATLRLDAWPATGCRAAECPGSRL